MENLPDIQKPHEELLPKQVTQDNQFELIEEDPEVKHLREVYTKEQVDQMVAEVGQRYNYPICGYAKLEADNKTLKICRVKAGAGTQHLGSGRCSHHSGNSGALVKHGQYGIYLNKFPTLQSLYEEFSNRDSQIKDLSEEINLLRALLAKHAEALKEDSTGELKDDHKTLSTLTRLLEILASLRKTIETKHEIDEESKLAVTFEGLSSLCWQIQKILEDEIKDKDLLSKIYKRIAMEVRLVTKR